MHRTLKMTSAMAANVSDHIWSVEELISTALADEDEGRLKRMSAGVTDRLWSVAELIEAATGEEYAQQSA
jgi:hypothetical protein